MPAVISNAIKVTRPAVCFRAEADVKQKLRKFDWPPCLSRTPWINWCTFIYMDLQDVHFKE